MKAIKKVLDFLKNILDFLLGITGTIVIPGLLILCIIDGIWPVLAMALAISLLFGIGIVIYCIMAAITEIGKKHPKKPNIPVPNYEEILREANGCQEENANAHQNK